MGADRGFTANPKGRLWEECARRGVAPPKIRGDVQGGCHRVQMVLEIGEWELDSGTHWGESRKVAEGDRKHEPLRG